MTPPHPLSPATADPLAAPRAPALVRFGPLALAVSTLAAVSMGLIAWSHESWGRLQARTHRVDTLLSTVQYQARFSVLETEQRVMGLPTARSEAPYQAMTEALALARTLHEESPEDLRPAMRALIDELESAADAVRARTLAPPALDASGLRRALDQVDAAVQHATRQWDDTLRADTTTQRRFDHLNIALVGVVTLLLIGLMRRADRQRTSTARKLTARDAQLRAFAEVLPDLAFRMDAQGTFLDVYGNNLPLLGRPPEAILGRPLSSLFPAEMTQRFTDVIDQTLHTRRTQSLSFSVRIHDDLRHFDSRCAPVGDTPEVVWMIWDITAHRQTEKRLRHKTRLYDFLSHVNQSIVRSADEASLLARVCRVAIEHGQFRKAWVVLHGDDPLQLRCQAVAGDDTPERPQLDFDLPPDAQQDSALEAALRQGHTYCSSNLGRLPRRPDWADAAIAAGLPGCVTVPLRRDERLIGHLVLLGRRVNDQAEDLLTLFDDLAKDLSFALTNLHREALRHQAEERIRLHAAALESTRDGMMVLSQDRVVVSVNAAFTTLTGWREEEVIGRVPDFLLPDDPTVTLDDIREGLLRDGSWQGEMWFQRQSGELFMTKLSVSAVHNKDGRPTHFVGVFTDITQLKQTEERLARMAHFDTLTELPNRGMIHQRLTHALSLAQRHHTLVGVVFIDLDNFKTVNDGLGHAAGDSLLRQVASRLRARVRQEDTLGRLGGDEFILVLEHLRHPQQAAHVASAILDTLQQPFTLDGGEQVYVRASIGISLFPNDGQEAADLIRNADAAMYESKRRGRNSFSFYTESFTSDATSRLLLETRLRRAMEQGDFLLHYQPQIRLSDRRITAVEALVRLRPPSGSGEFMAPVSPHQFIPVMEDTGMIVALGEWVLTEACRQGRAWLDAGLDFGRMSVNLSPSEIRRGGVVERVSRILRETGLPPHRLELEITESGLMESGGNTEQFLHMLHGLGVTLTIDDFGTGYSSLAYLKRFPVHQLKIDRSFVQDLPGNDNDGQLVATMIAMARGLKLNVVAEGVEMPDQEAYLASRGCDIVQGYLYSRPLTAPALATWLQEHPSS
ncbi:EAL domain-containing protein [Aquabacterium sp.]